MNQAENIQQLINKSRFNPTFEKIFTILFALFRAIMGKLSNIWTQRVRKSIWYEKVLSQYEACNKIPWL